MTAGADGSFSSRLGIIAPFRDFIFFGGGGGGPGFFFFFFFFFFFAVFSRGADAFHSSCGLRRAGETLSQRLLTLRQIVMHDLAKAERHIGDEMGDGKHLDVPEVSRHFPSHGQIVEAPPVRPMRP